MLYVCFGSCLHIVGLFVPVTPFFSLNTEWLTLILSNNVFPHLAIPQKICHCTNMLPSIFPRKWGFFPSFIVISILQTSLLSSKLELPRQPKYGCPCCQRCDEGGTLLNPHGLCSVFRSDRAVQRLPVRVFPCPVTQELPEGDRRLVDSAL